MSEAEFVTRLPATSANLGPGFDAVGIAMSLYLTVRARRSSAPSLMATGRDSDICGRSKDHLLLSTYTDILLGEGIEPPTLAVTLDNEIPLGMGCGSSAAALLAGVLLANHFGDLGWTSQQILDEACRREGHPDNVAACLFGGFTVSMGSSDGTITTASVGLHLPWQLILVLPKASLATTSARALLPETYSRADVVANISATALLVSAFASGRADLLRRAMRDRVHQPYRTEACPLLPLLLPLVGREGIDGVALSGAGPAVLLICERAAPSEVTQAIERAGNTAIAEILWLEIVPGAAISGVPLRVT